MATLNKTILSGYDVTGGDTSIEINNTQHYRSFTVEAILSGITYPAAENDAEIGIKDGELNDDHGAVVVNYETVSGGFAKIPDACLRVKVRVVDLATKNARVYFTAGSLTGGVIEDLTITFQT